MMFFSPAEMLRLSIRTGLMLTEAQMIIAMRMMGMAGLWSVRPGENRRMMTEKLVAAQQSGMAASSAMMAGKSATEVAEAALASVARQTRANVTRLARAPRRKPAKG